MQGFFRGFAFAARGVRTAIREERNFRFHLCAAFYVYLFSFFYSFSALQYIAITILVGGVLAAELLNTAVERIVDHLCPAEHRQAGLAKDMAAGAVLAFSAAAAMCGVLLYWNTEVFSAIFSYFSAHLWLLLPLAASLVASWWFIFRFNRKEH